MLLNVDYDLNLTINIEPVTASVSYSFHDYKPQQNNTRCSCCKS